MSLAKTHHAQNEQELRYRNRIIVMLFALLVLLGMALWRQPSVLRIYVPPDLSRPQFIAPSEIPPSYVYAFSKLLMEKLNYCPEDCGRDYAKNLQEMRHYLTASCYQDLAMHRERQASLYEFRSRKLLPVGEEIFDPQKVTRLDRNAWEVHVEYLLEEHVKGVETRRRRYHYPLRVVQYAIPVDLNAYQMAFDCYLPPGPRPVDVDNDQKG
jgi:integrating conjugative element protein (TIGR03746 family)